MNADAKTPCNLDEPSMPVGGQEIATCDIGVDAIGIIGPPGMPEAAISDRSSVQGRQLNSADAMAPNRPETGLQTRSRYLLMMRRLPKTTMIRFFY